MFYYVYEQLPNKSFRWIATASRLTDAKNIYKTLNSGYIIRGGGKLIEEKNLDLSEEERRP